ncbi:NDR1/HIN1-like protein 6, partial [Durio zibethinus]|uniref:NDR1/HIN1-like protein 6 n=1 Tax=Durio zibethinus TaxID=66656 RepID=A0A6P6BGI4_DURZI
PALPATSRGNDTTDPGQASPRASPPLSSFLPRDRRTKAHTWFAAAFCIIFWLLVIIGGLVVLIVYLVFRPRSPRFDVNSVTLKAAYLDMGYLLNADISMLANFTNPNKKVSVDFSSMYLDLYFENTLIATQSIEPFSAARGQSMFANIHMVTSQVRLSVKDTLLLQRQIENNRVMFTLKGLFRARSNLGGFLKYSYWLHGLCSVMVSSPPTGVLRDKRCRTKH